MTTKVPINFNFCKNKCISMNTEVRIDKIWVGIKLKQKLKGTKLLEDILKKWE